MKKNEAISILATSVRPREQKDRARYDEAVKMAIDALNKSEPKRGKWIYHIDDLFPAESTMECNQCHAEQPLICDDEFCPKCGAKMEGTT